MAGLAYSASKSQMKASTSKNVANVMDGLDDLARTKASKTNKVLSGSKNGKNYILDTSKSTGNIPYRNPILPELTQREWVEQNIKKSQEARRSSNFSDYLTKEKEVLERIKKASGADIKNNVPDSTLKHADLGDFNTNNRLINGGHGQSNIDYLKENNIDFNIVKEYPNGVRTGNGQSWFPKEWNDSKIRDAGNYVNNLPQNKNLPDGQWAFGDYDGVRVGIIKKDGKVTTIIPDNSKQP